MNPIFICIRQIVDHTHFKVKRLVHPKIHPFFGLCFTHPQSILGVYDFLLSDESNRSYIKNGPSLTMKRVLFVNSPEYVK